MGNLQTKTRFWDKNMILGIYELKHYFWELSPPPGLSQIDSPGRSEMSTPPDKSFETEVGMDGFEFFPFCPNIGKYA